MFDDVKEPEDILAGTDPVGAPKTPHVEAEKERIVAVNTALRKGPSPWVFIVIAAIVFGIIGGGGYYWWSLSSGNIPASEPDIADLTPLAPEGVDAPEPEPVIDEPVDDPDSATDPVNDPEPDTFMDTDGDGLDDNEEMELGTNPESVDTDNDELSDFDEVRIYSTDPTMPDTDGDGFLDGQEVSGGYNPNGPGTLFEIPTQ